jgi:hypothetical protein
VRCARARAAVWRSGRSWQDRMSRMPSIVGWLPGAHLCL